MQSRLHCERNGQINIFFGKKRDGNKERKHKGGERKKDTLNEWKKSRKQQ